MPDYFVPLDANYPDNPKFYGLDPLAELLMIRLFAAAKRAKRNGEFPRVGQAASYAHDCWERYGVQPDELVAALVAADLLESCEAGHRITGWVKHNGQRATSEAPYDPEDPADAAAFGNHRRWHTNRSKIKPGCRFCAADRGDVAPDSPPNRNRKEGEATTPMQRDAVEVMAEALPTEVASPDVVKATLASLRHQATPEVSA